MCPMLSLPLPESLPEIPRTMGVNEIAELYGLKYDKVYRLIKEGKLRAVETGPYSEIRVYDPIWAVSNGVSQLNLDDCFFLRECEVADLLRCTPRWVRYLATAKKLPSKVEKRDNRTRGNRRYSLTGVRIAMDYMERRRRQANGPYRKRPWVLQWLNQRMREMNVKVEDSPQKLRVLARKNAAPQSVANATTPPSYPIPIIEDD